MSFATFSDLKSEIAGWLHRADLTSTIPSFIALAETRINTILHARFQDTTSTVATVASVAYAALPESVLSLMSVYIDNVSTSLDYIPPDKFAQRYATSYTGVPVAYTIIGEQIQFGPVPDSIYTVTLNYSASVTPLSDDSPTNTLLTKFPHVYLSAAMVWASKYIKDLPAAQRWEADFQDAIANVNLSEWQTGGPMRITTDVRVS